MISLRHCLPLALAALCCACTTPEEKADAAFAELCAVAEQVRAELAAITDAGSAEAALPVLEEQARALSDVLTRLDDLAEDPDLPQEARRRLGEQYHEPLHAVADAAMREAHRIVVRHALYQSKGLGRLARAEYAHYGNKHAHPWPRAVLAGREYRPKPPKKQD